MTALLLRCSACGQTLEANPRDWRCPACASPLERAEPGRFDRSMIDTARAGLWRYRQTLPVDTVSPVTLNEPMTPLVPMSVAGATVLGKLDGLLPTGSFKDRGMSVLVSFLKQQGVARVIEDSSGNAAASIAGYAARAGIACTVYAPATASPGKLVQAAAFGAEVKPITGTRDDVARAAETAAEQPGASYATHNWHPLFIEGIKTWALEIWEQLGFEAPDAIITPAGSGSAVLGAWRAFAELRASNEIARMPRIFAAQAAACAPLVAAMSSGSETTVPFDRTPSLAEGIMIADPVRGKALLEALRASNGGAVAMSEPAIHAALLDAAHQGVYVEPTSATAFAAARDLLERGILSPSERIVILMTGNGLKATSAIGELLSTQMA
jgi:threonine synthase